MTINNITIFFIVAVLTRFDLHKIQKEEQIHNKETIQLACFQENWPLRRTIIRLRDSTLNWKTRKDNAKNQEQKENGILKRNRSGFHNEALPTERQLQKHPPDDRSGLPNETFPTPNDQETYKNKER